MKVLPLSQYDLHDPRSYSMQKLMRISQEAVEYARSGPRFGPLTVYGAGTKTGLCLSYAFAQGAEAPLSFELDDRPGPMAMMPSPDQFPWFQEQLKSGRGVWCLDKGYFGRGQFYRSTWNRLQHDGSGDAGFRRFEIFRITVEAWRKTGDHILICPNSKAWYKMHGMEEDAWLQQVCDELREHTDRRIKIRGKLGYKGTTLQKDLENCWAVVVFTSNCALEAVMAGIPAFATGDCAAVGLMNRDLSKIENPDMPSADERFERACNLAANQWTLDEFRSGAAWGILRERMG